MPALLRRVYRGDDLPLIIPPPSLSVHSTEASDVDLTFDCSFVALIAAALSSAFSRTIDGAYDFRVTHLEV